MRKFILCILFMAFCGISLADNTEKVKEYQDRSMQLRQTLAQYQQAIQNIQVELIKLDGKIELLREQDRAKAPEEKEDEEKDVPAD